MNICSTLSNENQNRGDIVSQKSIVQRIQPLTPLQNGILFHSIVDKQTTAYFQQMVLSLTGKLDLEIFLQSVNKLIERHEIFRTSFIYEKVKKPMQVVLKKRELKDIYYEDISDQENQAATIQTFLDRDKKQRFDLSKDVLMRISIFRTDEQSYTVVWSYHHILMDGWSLGIVLNEFFQIYHSLYTNQPLQLEPFYSYSDYVNWLQEQDKSQASEYWSRYLEHYENPAVVPFENKQKDGEYLHTEKSYELDADLTNAIRAFARECGVTVNTVFETIWGLLLQKYNRTNDVVFGSVVSGRNADVYGIDKMVGLFINTVPVRIKVDENLPFSRFVKMMQDQSFASRVYDFFPLYEIPIPSNVRQGLINHTFIFENFPVQVKRDEQSLTLRVDQVKVVEHTNYDFNLLILDMEKISIVFSYNARAYSQSAIEKIYGHFRQFLETIMNRPDILIKEIDPLTSEEKSALLSVHQTAISFDREKTIHESFEEQVSKSPEKVALVCGEDSLTYEELNIKANQLARILRAKGVQADRIVGIQTKRSLEMMIGILAILKAGGAYLPIDPDFPEDRVKFMLEDSQASLLLTQSQIPVPESYKGDVLLLDDPILYQGKDSNLSKVNTAQHLAYVIYTSGSTGKPKGVMIEHRAVQNFISGITDKISFSSDKSILCLTTMSFDIFVLESLLPLTQGLKVVMAEDKDQKNPALISQLIQKHQVNMLQFTPTRMQMLLEYEADQNWIHSITEIMIGGEAVPESLVSRLKALTEANIYNMYGPTETTIWSLVKDLRASDVVTIGQPIANTKVYIVDHNDHLQPIGVPGELCIAGAGLGRGYLNRPELTSEKFINNDFEGKGKIYKTGDLVCLLPNGEIQFLGRLDEQVKIRGYRVELGEIENRLLSHHLVKEVAVVVKETDVDKLLCAYVVSDQTIEASELRAFLSKSLPEYMIPNFYEMIDQLPLTPNGKVNRRELSKRKLEGNWSSKEPTLPRTETEKALVEIWKSVLQMDHFGIHDHFFDVGGNSILLIQVHAQIEKRYPGRLDLDDLFAYPTIAKLVKIIDGEEMKVSQAIELKSIKMPREYLVTGGEANENTILSFILPEELTNNLKAVITQLEGVQTYDVLSSVYAYLWHEITGQEKVVFYMNDERHLSVWPMELNFAEVQDFLTLFSSIAHKRQEADQSTLIPLEALVRKENELDDVTVFISNRQDITRDGLECFDMILLVDQSQNQISFQCQYNPTKIKKRYAEALMQAYVKLIKLMLESIVTV